jgi:serine protease AprX
MIDKDRLFRLIMVFALVGILIGSMGYYYLIYRNSSYYPERTEWAYDMIEATELNDAGYFGEEIVVAVIDTGIDLEHREFERYRTGELPFTWLDFVNQEPEPYDDNGHGTAMAGLLAGKFYGIAPYVELIVVKTISAKGTGDVDHIAKAIRFAVHQGADVISMSLGGGRFPIIGTDAERACVEAVEDGVYVVAAAGNDGESDNGDVDSPSNVELVISAGSVDSGGKIAPFSSAGDNDGPTRFLFDDRLDPNKKPEIVAPGVNINVPMTEDRYGVSSGTSVSTVLVSGIIALTLDANEDYQQEYNRLDDTIRDYKSVMKTTAEKAPGQSTSGHDEHYGYGILKGYALSESL